MVTEMYVLLMSALSQVGACMLSWLMQPWTVSLPAILLTHQAWQQNCPEGHPRLWMLALLQCFPQETRPLCLSAALRGQGWHQKAQVLCQRCQRG
jgi:hypothetical protein